MKCPTCYNYTDAPVSCADCGAEVCRACALPHRRESYCCDCFITLINSVHDMRGRTLAEVMLRC